MRVEQNASSGPPPVQPVKEQARAQTVLAQGQATPSLPAVGLKVSISDAGRQAANSMGAATVAGNGAGVVAPATESPIPHTLMEGVPWPVGFGPPAFPQTQGAAGVARLVAAQVPQLPQQNPALFKAPSGAESASEAAQAKTVPETAAQLQASVAGASPQSQRDARGTVTSTEPRKTSSVYASDAALVPGQEQKLNLRA